MGSAPSRTGCRRGGWPERECELVTESQQRVHSGELGTICVSPVAESYREHTAGQGRAFLPNLLGLLIVAVGLAAYIEGQPMMVWAALPFSFWLAWQAPEKLVGLLLLSTPIFPVIRVVEDRLGAQQVSTRGLYFALDDPLILALLLGAMLRQITRAGKRIELFPAGLLGLAALYPLVIALNTTRLEFSQSMVSFLYYLKWLQYASVLILIPAVMPMARTQALLKIVRRCLTVTLLASAIFAAYEIVEAFRTASYRSAGLFPRASSFFGTLDPLRFGASEDPVNFGVFMMVGGSIALAYATQCRRRNTAVHVATVAAAIVGVLLSASRTPILAAGVAYNRLRRITFGQTAAVIFGLISLVIATQLLFPNLWATTWVRFESIVFEELAIDGSAGSRLNIMLNAPVFEWDSYWFAGHGHSAYRFVAEQHLAKFTNGLSRSLYNFPLTIWYDAGLFGFLLWCALFVQLWRRFKRISMQSVQPELRALASGLQAALFGLATASLFGEFPYNWRVMGYFYACCGACLAADRAERWWSMRAVACR